MSCYKPNVMVWDGNFTEAGKKHYTFLGRQKKPITVFDDVSIDGRAISVPCGKCIGCRLDYARQWADRMFLELAVQKKAIFVTLTYDNDHVPVSMWDANNRPLAYSLNKRDVQLFFKRLRERFPGVKIRYFLAGEYGKRTFRPHYHSIIYGLDISDFNDAYIWKYNELGQPYYISPFFEKSIWENGFCVLSEVTYETMCYTARYCLKKKYGFSRDHWCAQHNAVPEFSLMSRKPGIGFTFFDENPDFHLDNTRISLYNGGTVKDVTVPKAVFKKLEEFDPVTFERLKDARQRLARDATLLELAQTDLPFEEYLDLKASRLGERTLPVLRRNYDST